MNTPTKNVPVAPEPKPPDGRERSDQTQPMDLANRTVTLSSVPSSTHGGSVQGQEIHTSVPPTVNLRPLSEPPKVSFSAVSFRVPTRPTTSLTVPTVGHSSTVGTIQSLSTKTGNQVTTLSRHGVNTLQTVMSLSGNSNITTGSMASIIRGSHLLPQTVSGHLAHPQVHAQFSSHVPRGPAAVASISAAPKTAVATPILRPAQHASATVALAVSTASGNPTFMPGCSQGVTVGRTATPPVPKVTSPALAVIDFQKQLAHGAPSQVHLGVAARQVEGPLRSTCATNLPLSKPVHISQPIVQHLQQIPEKGFYKSTTTVSNTIGQTQLSLASSHGVKPTGMVTVSLGHTTTTASSTSGIQVSQHGPTSAPTITPPRTATNTSVVSVSPAASMVQVPALSQHQRQMTASLQSSATVTTAVPTPASASAPPHQLTVVSKALPPAIHTVSPIFHQQPIPSTNKPSATLHISSLVATTSTSSTTTSTLLITSSVARPVSTTTTSTTTTLPSTPIPVAKVFPQPLTSTSSRPVGSTESQLPESSTAASFFLAHNSRAPSSTVATTVASSTPTVGLPTTVVLSDSRNERSGTSAGAPYALPAAYFYEPYVQGTITMHPYGSAQSVQSFSASIPASAALRPGLLTQHSVGAVTSVASAPSSTASVAPVGNATAVTPVRPLNPVMVSVDPSQRHVTLHPGYQATNSNIAGAEVVVTQGNSTPTLFTVTTTSGSTVGLGFTNQMMSYNPPQSQSTTTNHNTSPRPSILRKRTSDGTGVAVKKSILTSFPLSGPSSPHVEASNLSSASSQSPKPQGTPELPKDSVSVSSLVHHESADNSKIQSTNSPAITIKQEPLETSDNGFGNSINGSSNTTTPASSVTVEASPRKKPRKQQLAANELLEVQSTDGEDEFEREMKEPIKKEPVKEGNDHADEEKVKWVTFCKRPSMSLLNSYRHTWKSRHNHFIRHSDVKPKEEKKCTVNELANQKGVLQKTNGWKIYHLVTQMDEVVELEDILHGRLSHMLEFIENKPPAMKARPLNDDEDRILNKINDLLKGNLQRSRIVQDQVAEAKQQVMKVLDHKTHIVNIISKYVSKRPLKKKEKC